MSEFKELVKSFPKTREYVRDFFVYGFKTRDEFKEKSGRTYDNERRRIESWLGKFVKQDYTEKGKNISLAIDSNLQNTNPLFRVWKTKSFTDNDMMLHFFLLDYMTEDEGFTIEELTDGIMDIYEGCFDEQMIRRKCNAYVKEGLLRKEKEGKNLLYYKNANFKELADEVPRLKEALAFYQMITPLGVVGNMTLDTIDSENDIFYVKHNFFVHTLEDEVLLDILSAMREQRAVTVLIRGSKSMQETYMSGVPLQILTSTRTGRRFLCVYVTDKQSFTSLRMDTIKQVTCQEVVSEYEDLKQALLRNHQYLWGVSFRNGGRDHVETVKLTLHINEDTEDFMIERLEREGKGGTITRISPDTFTYEKQVFDSNEMLPWIRTFTGRIVKLECSNPWLEQVFKQDMNALYDMYGIK